MTAVLAVARHSRRRLGELGTLTTRTRAFAPAAYASGSSMPWETPLNSILESVQGPVAKIISVIIITVTGLTLAFGDTSGGFRRLIQIVFGLSIAFAASSFFLSFFRSEEHTSELQSLMRISYAVFCLKKKKYTTNI